MDSYVSFDGAGCRGSSMSLLMAKKRWIGLCASILNNLIFIILVIMMILYIEF